MVLPLQWQHYTHICFINVLDTFYPAHGISADTFCLDECGWMDGQGCHGYRFRRKKKPNLKSESEGSCLRYASASTEPSQESSRMMSTSRGNQYGKQASGWERIQHQRLQINKEDRKRLNPEAECPLVQVFFVEELWCHAVFILVPQMGKERFTISVCSCDQRLMWAWSQDQCLHTACLLVCIQGCCFLKIEDDSASDSVLSPHVPSGTFVLKVLIHL